MVGLILVSAIAAPAGTAGENRVPGAALPAGEAHAAGPVPLRLDHAAGVALRIDLPPATVPEAPQKGRRPLRIGIHRDVPREFQGDLAPRLDWRLVGDGAVAAAVLVSSPQATSIRVGVYAKLPPGAQLRFFRPSGEGEALAVVTPAELLGEPISGGRKDRTGNGRRAASAMGKDVNGPDAEIFWSPSVDGDVIGIEITLPSRAAAGTSRFRVAKVAHRFLDPRSASFKALTCAELHVDIQCRVDRFPGGLENAVARIDFETQGGSSQCSGTLLNDGNPDTFIAYFLTANHCVSTAAEARTVQATWFYQLENCGAETVDLRTATTFGGADLVATSAPHDTTLLKLRRRLPAGVFFAGWDATGALETDGVIGIHHPKGEVKKYSAGDVFAKADSRGVTGAIGVDWEEGVTEGGSSGSALFRDGLAIGALSHGATCDTGIYRDFYGPFAALYPRVCSALNPGGGCGDGDHDLPSTAREIAAGDTGMDALDEAGDIDYWRVDIPSYGTLIVATTGDADTIGTLENDQGVALEKDDDGGTGRNFRIERDVDRGTYYVRIAGADDGLGAYRLRVDHTPTAIDALPTVAWNDGTIAAIGSPREVDHWRLEVPADGAVALFTTGGVDTVGLLEDAAGESLARNDDGGIGTNFRIDALLPAGIYLLKVSGYEDEVGLYTLRASHTPLTEMPAIAEGGSAGEIEAPTESAHWRFDVSSLGVSTLETTGPTDTQGWLHASADEHVATDDDGGEDLNFRIERTLTAGTYYARVRAFEDAVGSYVVTASHVVIPAADVLDLDADGRATGSIGEAGAVNTWRFEVEAAALVTVETIGSLDTFGTLEDGLGRAWTDDDSGHNTNFRIARPLVAGTYYVRVRGLDSATGDYVLRVHSDNDVGDTPAAAAALAVGTTQHSSVGSAGDVDYWRLAVPSAGTVVLQTEGATDTLGTLEDALGATLARDDDGGEGRNFRIAHQVFPGTYFVRVSGYGTAIGAYALRVAHTRSPLSIPWFLAAEDAARGRQGFARLINRSERAGTVRVHAIDDEGTRAGFFDLALQAGETVHFNSNDLESGNPAKGIAAGVGAGVGDWRLELDTDLDLNVLAYVRTAQGFLTNMHDSVPPRPTQGTDNSRYVVPIFNPASNRRQVSKLRLFNLGDGPASVTITGFDDDGEPAPGGGIRLVLAPAAARTLSAEQLENGEGIDGSFGDGRGKWELTVLSTQPLGVMNLLESPPAAEDTADGNLTNLSTASLLPAVAPGARPCSPCEVPLFIAADDPLRQGFVRLSNYSAESGSVEIHAIDDAGQRSAPVTIAMDAGATVHFNSDDLEEGNPAKGLSGRTGDGLGDWRLLVRTNLDIVGPLAYARTSDGFLTSLHDLVRADGYDQRRYRVPVFNPASNRNQRSQLRIVNPTPHDAAVTIAGVDDRGRQGPLGEVAFTLPAGHARTLDAEQLERGHDDLNGRLGDGTGKWQLLVASDQPLRVLSLLQSATGNLTNLSSSPQR